MVRLARNLPTDRPVTPRFRPCLQVLEDRTLPSVLTVLNLNDHGSGSLRDQLSQAQDGDTVVFARSVAARSG
jgi:hypothetical protein